MVAWTQTRHTRLAINAGLHGGRTARYNLLNARRILMKWRFKICTFLCAGSIVTWTCLVSVVTGVSEPACLSHARLFCQKPTVDLADLPHEEHPSDQMGEGPDPGDVTLDAADLGTSPPVLGAPGLTKNGVA